MVHAPSARVKQYSSSGVCASVCVESIVARHASCGRQYFEERAFALTSTLPSMLTPEVASTLESGSIAPPLLRLGRIVQTCA